MGSTYLRSSWFPSLVVLLTIGLCAITNAQPLPRSVMVAANPPGTVFYALASGLAKVAGEGAPFSMVVQPYSGTSTFLPLLDSGEIDFGINNAVDMALSYQGPERLKIGGSNPFQHTPNVRLVMRGAILMTALLVRKDTPMKSVAEIRGKRLTGEYPAQLANWYNIFGFLAGAGMSFADVKIVPVPGANEGVDALIQGRADVALHAVDSAKDLSAPLRELDVSTLHLLILEHILGMPPEQQVNGQTIRYSQDDELVLQTLEKEDYQAAFILAATKKE